MNPYDEVETLIEKISECIETLKKSDVNCLDVDQMIFLGRKGEELYKLAFQKAISIGD